MVDTYEFKLWEAGRSWKSTDVFVSRTFGGTTQESLDRQAAAFAENQAWLLNTEIRWNRQGNPQGHYVGTDRKFARLYANR